MYPGRMDIARQLDAVDTLLTDAEMLPDTLEVELHLYRDRLLAAVVGR
jgi:hypothetical protein